MDLKELAKKAYPDTDVEIKGKTYPYFPDLQRDGFVKGYKEALEQLKECWKDAQYEMHKSFSSSYVGITFEKWLELKFKKTIDFSKISNIEFDDVDPLDAPDYCDAYILSCDIDGEQATEDELNEINKDSDFIHEKLFNYLN